MPKSISDTGGGDVVAGEVVDAGIEVGVGDATVTPTMVRVARREEKEYCMIVCLRLNFSKIDFEII